MQERVYLSDVTLDSSSGNPLFCLSYILTHRLENYYHLAIYFNFTSVMKYMITIYFSAVLQLHLHLHLAEIRFLEPKRQYYHYMPSTQYHRQK